MTVGIRKRVRETAPRQYRKIDRDDIRAVLQPLKDTITAFERFTHPGELDRIAATAARIPVAQSEQSRIVDLGGTVLWLPIYRELLNYRRISLVQLPGYLAWAGWAESRLREEYGCDFVPANVDKMSYPIEAGSAATVVCFELLEHLQGDPMNLISESNRILSDGGQFYITTPNLLYSYNLVNFMFGEHPYGWSVYTSGYGDRHNREYTAFELSELLHAGGFRVEQLETLTYTPRGSAMKRLAGHLLSLVPAAIGRVPLAYRGAFSHLRARKESPVRERYPKFLYDMMGTQAVCEHL